MIELILVAAVATLSEPIKLTDRDNAALEICEKAFAYADRYEDDTAQTLTIATNRKLLTCIKRGGNVLYERTDRPVQKGTRDR